jgi:hypothetical protein
LMKEVKCNTFFHKLPLSTMALQITPPIDMGTKYL